MYVASFMRNSPDGQILGHPNPGIPRRVLWWLISIVVASHAALLLDFSAITNKHQATTRVSSDALLTTLADDTTPDPAAPARRVPSVRWLSSPPPAPKPSVPRPTVVTKPIPPAPPPVDVPEAAAAEPADTLEAADSRAPGPPSSGEAEPSTPVFPAPSIAVPPTQTRLVYDITGLVKGRNVFADGLFEWTVQDGRYDASLAVRMLLLGTRTQTSVGRIGPQGLMPDRFGERQRDEAATHFDYEGQRVRFSRNRPDAPLTPGTQDRLSVILQLATQLQSQPLQAGESITVPVASSREVEVWAWSIGELQTVDLPQGPALARHLIRPALHERDNTVELWMAPSLQHLPVRIRITQSNGDWLDQRLVLAP